MDTIEYSSKGPFKEVHSVLGCARNTARIVPRDEYRAVKSCVAALLNYGPMEISVVKDLHVRAAWAGNLTLAGADRELREEEREGSRCRGLCA